MVEAADVGARESVLEVGPGQGALTQYLVRRGADVLALEFDERLIPLLKTKFEDVRIEQGDIRSYDLSTMPDEYKIVANIPYYLTAHLIRMLTEPKAHKPIKAALLIQKEVAERIAARPGQLAFISVAAQFYYEVSLGREVAAELFSPPPKVDSQILILTKRAQPLFPKVDSKDFLRFVKISFAQRRKTLLNNLASGLHVDKQQVLDWAAAAGIDPSRRPQTLTMEEWHTLYVTSRA
jgi:16S rRNA (adenine1518-N6/adenine1519-N6)-dimethyltransferase